MKKAIWISAALTAVVVAGCGAFTQQSNTTSPVIPTTSPTQPSTANGASAPAATSSVLKTQTVTLTVLPGGRLGPDGKMHDTFTDPNFTVVEGVPVKLSVYNYDSGSHSITNGDLNLNLQAKGFSKQGVPGVTSVTFTPTKTGDFKWQCVDPCDGQNQDWSMSHVGYMEGMIHVLPNNDKQYIYLTIKDGLQYAAADGKMHDSYSPANFTVQEGIPVQVTVENFDSGKHSMTAPGLGLNQVLQGAAKEGVPATTSFTFTPTKDGTFHWMCVIQCDGNGWAMTHDGYMAGNITVTT
jgi:heme/copper-type cytochrome/quinol oxidase subunit 2